MDETERPVDEHEARMAQANKLYQTGVMLMYGRRKSVEKAIKCIQRAIVLDDKNYKFWQMLGEAYYQRGSLNPAINCFIKSLALADHLLGQESSEEEKTRIRSDSIYSRLRMSDIRLSVQHLEEAMSGYADIISSDPKNVAALVGMSKAELLMARNSFHNGLVKSGHMHCMNALKFALRATKLSPHLCYTLKLVSDCCLIQVIYGQRSEFSTRLDVPELFSDGSQDGLVITRSNCIDLSQQFLCKALAIDSFQDSSCLWHNLGISLYLKSSLSRPAECEGLLKRSLKCLLRALDCDRTNSQVRNSIGIVAYQMNLLNTAQSFLIKSIQTNMSTSEIQFSNLGFIFLQKGEFRLAGVAFKRCQAEEPLYCRSWLGNAILNEQDNLDNMSYLRHCHKLENNYESQMMYATKVTSLPHSEEYSKDLVNALDCMKRVIEYDDKNPAAQNTLGLLFERCNLKEQARRCFDTAHQLAPDDSRVIFNRLRQQTNSQVGCCKGTSPENVRADPSAINADLIKMAERLSNSGNRDYALNFIRYLLDSQDFQSIGSRTSKVIEKLRQDEIPAKLGAQILLAMVDKAQGSDYKSWLFKNVIDSEGVVCVESLINLFTLMLFGSMAGDQQLVEQVFEDLSSCLISYLSTKSSCPFYSLEGLWLRLTLVCSIFCCKNQSKILRTMLVLFPMIPELWLFQGMSLMLQQKQEPLIATFCIQKASLIGSTNADLRVISEILLAILSHRRNIKSNKNKLAAASSDAKERLNHLSKALFKCPNYQILRDCCLATSGQQAQERTSRDADLFQLALDHTIRTLVVQ